MKNVVLFIFAIIVMIGCKSAKTKIEDSMSDENQQITIVKSVERDPQFRMSYEDIDYKIENAMLSNEILTISGHYNGGCGTNSFNLKFNGMYAKSLPVQAVLYLSHTSENDTCNTKVPFEFKFDVSEVQHPKHKEVTINLMGYSEKFSYKY